MNVQQTLNKNIKKILLISPFVIVLLLFSFLFLEINDFEYGILSRILMRLESIQNIFKYGFLSDESMNIRLASYLHFLDNIPKIGLGSGDMNNYFIYADGASFDTSLMLRNTHSLIIEVGYWLGWPGLLFFLIMFGYLLLYTQKRLTSCLILLVASFIPSSMLGNIYYLTFFILILLYKENNCNPYE